MTEPDGSGGRQEEEVGAGEGTAAGDDPGPPDLADGARADPDGSANAEQSADSGAAEAKEHGPEAPAADGLLDALGHLQAAALSMVAAARAAVDAAEQLVRDPKPLLDILADAARAGWEQPPAPAGADAPARPRVEHIAVRPPADPVRPRGDDGDGAGR